MTDKPIINGVDVSGCKFWFNTFCGYGGQNYCQIHDCVCEEPIGDDCYYKQCARKDERIRELEYKLEEKEQQWAFECGCNKDLVSLQQKLSQIAELANKYADINSPYYCGNPAYYNSNPERVELAQQIKQIAEGE